MSDVKTQADVTDVRPLDLEAARIAVKPIVDAELQAERPVGCLRCIELQRDISALQSRCEAAERDARRYRWLRPRLFSTDWNYGEPPVSVITFRFPDVPVGVGDNLDAAIDTAIKEAGLQAPTPKDEP